MTNMDIRLITDKIKCDKGLDLSGYKETTLRRRIERRMLFDGASSLEEYIQMIDRDHHLYWRLVSDFFIGVTDFFRDPDVWEVVREKVLPDIVMCHESCVMRKNREASFVKREAPDASRDTPHEVRIWSAGCSSGEETYSLAMAVKEASLVCHPSGTKFPQNDNVINDIRVVGTDIMEDKLETAKEGIYEAEKVEKVEERLREEYFVMSHESCDMRKKACHPRESLPAGRHGGDPVHTHEIPASPPNYRRASAGMTSPDAQRIAHYAIRNDVRQLTSFCKYDLVKGSSTYNTQRMTHDDKFDMIVCRNVLIYFQRQLQEKVIKHFYMALKPGGVLWLGKGETLWNETNELFEPVFRREKIFRKAITSYQ